MLGEAEAALSGEPGYIDALTELAVEPQGNVSDGATWLIKSALENGARLSPDQVGRFCEQLEALQSWAAQLHVCQSIRFLEVPRDEAAGLAGWLDPLLSHTRPFLRAWALDALYRLAKQHDSYRKDLERALSAAMDDDAASVRARARNLK